MPKSTESPQISIFGSLCSLHQPEVSFVAIILISIPKFGLYLTFMIFLMNLGLPEGSVVLIKNGFSQMYDLGGTLASNKTFPQLFNIYYFPKHWLR